MRAGQSSSADTGDGPASGPISYLSLLRLPGAAWLAAAAFVARIPTGMSLVAVVLLIHETKGSFAEAGAVVAGVTISRSVFAGPWGRAADRLGYTPTLVTCAAINAASLVALLVAARGGAPTAVLIGCGALNGASLPALNACMPHMWAVLAGGRADLQAALTLEAVTRELVVITGPLAAAALVAVASPDAAIVAMIVFTLAGTLAFAASPVVRAQTGTRPATGHRGALGVPAVRTFVLAGTALGAALGTVQIAIPAFADQQGSRAAAGGLFACWAVGSLLTGLWYGRRRWSARLEHRYAVLLAVLPLSLLLLSLAGSIPAMAVLMLVAGAPMAPANATLYALIERAAPPGTATEALALYPASMALGMAAGNAAAGQLVVATSPSWTLAVGALAAALAAPIVAARRATLRPAPMHGAVAPG